MKKWMKAVLIGVVVFALVAGIAAIVCIGHYVGFLRACRSPKDRLPNKDSLSGI